MNVILWDWDNTLVDTIEPVMRALNAVLEDYHFPILTKEQFKDKIHCAGKQLFSDLFPNQNFT